MSALTSAQIQAVLLETVNTVVPKMFESGDSTMMLFSGGKKLSTTTRSFRQPLMMYPGGNYRYVDFEGDYGRGSAYQPVLATSVPVERLVATELTARIPMLTDSNQKSVLNLLTEQMQNAVDEWDTMTDRDIQGSGNGVFATIASGGVSGTTLTLASPFYEQGMRVNDVYYVQDSGQTLTRGSFSVVSIDEVNHTIVISSLPAGTVAGDVLVIEGYGVATTTTLQGIAYHQSNASTGTWENLSRVTYPYIRTPSINASGTLTVAYCQKLITLVNMFKGGIVKTGTADWVWHTHPIQTTEIIQQLQQQAFLPWTRSTSGEDIDPGKQVKDQMQVCGITMHTSNHASRTRVDLLKRSNWFRIQYKDVGPAPMGDGNTTWLPVYGASGGYGGKNVMYLSAAEQVCVEDPRAGGYIYNVTEPSGY